MATPKAGFILPAVLFYLLIFNLLLISLSQSTLQYFALINHFQDNQQADHHILANLAISCRNSYLNPSPNLTPLQSLPDLLANDSVAWQTLTPDGAYFQQEIVLMSLNNTAPIYRIILRSGTQAHPNEIIYQGTCSKGQLDNPLRLL